MFAVQSEGVAGALGDEGGGIRTLKAHASALFS